MSKLTRFAVKFAALLTFAILFFIIGYILIKGISYLKPSMFEFEYKTENVSMFPSIVTTIMIVGLTLLIATPIGVFTGFYLVEYAKKGSKLVELE